MNEKSITEIKLAFIKNGGSLRFAEAINLNISPRTLKDLISIGVLEKLSKGLYSLVGHDATVDPDMFIVFKRIPKSILCLTSSLSFHEMTTQIPHEISIALIRGAKQPVIDYPPIKVYHFSSVAYSSGIQEHNMNGFTLRVYSPEKTLADCFKFRNKIGMDIVLEALDIYRARKDKDLIELIKQAKVCRVENVMRPYLEMIV